MYNLKADFDNKLAICKPLGKAFTNERGNTPTVE
jgi:hypothetical protein